MSGGVIDLAGFTGRTKTRILTISLIYLVKKNANLDTYRIRISDLIWKGRKKKIRGFWELINKNNIRIFVYRERGFFLDEYFLSIIFFLPVFLNAFVSFSARVNTGGREVFCGRAGFGGAASKTCIGYA